MTDAPPRPPADDGPDAPPPGGGRAPDAPRREGPCAAPGSGPAAGQGRAPWIALGACVAAAWLVQCVVLRELKLAALGSDTTGPAREIAARAVSGLSPAGWTILAAAAAACVALAWGQVRRGWLTAILDRAVACERTMIALVSVAALFAVRAYFDSGDPHRLDSRVHVGAAVATAEIMQGLESPDWTWRFLGGAPLNRVYGPLLDLVTGFLSLTGLAPALALKLALALTHAASGAAVYLWARALWRSHPAAGLAALLHLFCHQRDHTLFELGRLPEAFLHLGFPLALYGVERCLRAPDALAAAVLAAGGAAMFLAHALVGSIAALVVGLYAVARLVAIRPAPGQAGAALVALGAGAALSLAAVAFWLVPCMAAKDFTLLRGGDFGRVSAFLSRKPPGGSTLGLLLRWTWSDRGGPMVAYAGWSVVALAAWTVVRRWRSRACAPLLAATAFCLWQLGGTYFLVRSVACLPVLLAGLAAGWLPARGDGRTAPRRLVIAAFVVAALDLVPLTLHANFRPGTERIDAGIAEAARLARGGRVAILHRRGGRLDLSYATNAVHSGAPVVAGWSPECSTPAFPWNFTAFRMLRNAVRDGAPLPPEVVATMRTFGIAALVVEDGRDLVPAGIPPGAGYTCVGSPPVLLLDPPAPLTFARTHVVDPSEPAGGANPIVSHIGDSDDPRWPAEVRALVARMGTSATASVAGVVVLAEDPGTAPAAAAGDAAFEVVSGTTGHREIEMRFRCGAGGWVVLPYSWYPDVRVLLDGETVPARRTRQNSLAVAAAPGDHTLRVLAPPLHGGSLGGSITGAAAAAVAAALWLRRRRLRAASRGA